MSKRTKNRYNNTALQWYATRMQQQYTAIVKQFPTIHYKKHRRIAVDLDVTAPQQQHN